VGCKNEVKLLFKEIKYLCIYKKN